MDDHPQTRTHPGRWRLWFAAWSAQGVAVLMVDSLALEPLLLRWAVTGITAAIPLVALYAWLGRSR